MASAHIFLEADVRLTLWKIHVLVCTEMRIFTLFEWAATNPLVSVRFTFEELVRIQNPAITLCGHRGHCCHC